MPRLGKKENGLAVPRGSGLALMWRRQNNTDELERKEGRLQAEERDGQCYTTEPLGVSPHVMGAAGRGEIPIARSLNSRLKCWG